MGVPPPSVLKMKINTVPQANTAAVVTLLTAYCCCYFLDITVVLLPHKSVQTVISYIREYSHDDDAGVFFFDFSIEAKPHAVGGLHFIHTFSKEVG